MGKGEFEGKGASVLEFTDLTPNGKPEVRTSKMHLETTVFLVATWEQENNQRKSCPGLTNLTNPNSGLRVASTVRRQNLGFHKEKIERIQEQAI